jgi:WD40 repeat protein
LLPSGKVLAAGGFIYQFPTNGNLASAELFDPATGTWTMTGALPGTRSEHTATLLPNGKVLITGGTDGTNSLSSTLLYDPASGDWAASTSLSAARAEHGAILLANGQVLVSGGNDVRNSFTSSAELYDLGLDFGGASQPRIASISWPHPGGGVSVSGSGFRGISEAASGNSQDSPADYPVLELISLQNGQTFFMPTTDWSQNSIATPPVDGLPAGFLLATVFVNGIPSAGQIVKSPTIPISAISPGRMLRPAVGPDGVTVSFTGTAGVSYDLQRAPALTGPWSTIATVPVGDSGIGNSSDPDPTAGKAFYRTLH